MKQGKIPSEYRAQHQGLCNICKCEFICEEIDGKCFGMYDFLVNCPYCGQNVEIKYTDVRHMSLSTGKYKC